MIIAVVGSGGKTTFLKKMAAQYRKAGKSVFVTTTTHMFIEDDTVLTDDADVIIRRLKENGYVMAGIQEGEKIKGLCSIQPHIRAYHVRDEHGFFRFIFRQRSILNPFTFRLKIPQLHRKEIFFF